MCGFSAEEAVGQSLAIVQGAGTDTALLEQMTARLLEGNRSGALVTNYHASGAAFRNDLKAAPLRDASGDITHFVGILSNISDVAVARASA